MFYGAYLILLKFMKVGNEKRLAVGKEKSA